MTAIAYDAQTRCFHLANDRVSYILRLGAGAYPLHLYWGRRVRAVHDDLLSRLTPYTDETFSLHETPLDLLPQECPVMGGADLREGMLAVRHADGTDALDLRYERHEILEGKPQLAGLPSARGEGAKTLLLTLRDAQSGLSVELAYTIYDDADIIARSARIINGGAQAVTLERALSACVDFEKARRLQRADQPVPRAARPRHDRGAGRGLRHGPVLLWQLHGECSGRSARHGPRADRHPAGQFRLDARPGRELHHAGGVSLLLRGGPRRHVAPVPHARAQPHHHRALGPQRAPAAHQQLGSDVLRL